MGFKKICNLVRQDADKEGFLLGVANRVIEDLKNDFIPHSISLMTGKAVLLELELMEQEETQISDQLAEKESWLIDFLPEGHILLARTALYNLMKRDETRYADYSFLRFSLNSHYIDPETDLGLSEEKLEKLLAEKKSAAYKEKITGLIAQALAHLDGFNLILRIDEDIRRSRLNPSDFDHLFKGTKLETFSNFRLQCWKRATQNSYNGLKQYKLLKENDHIDLVRKVSGHDLFSEEELRDLKELYRRGKRITHLTEAELKGSEEKKEDLKKKPNFLQRIFGKK